MAHWTIRIWRHEVASDVVNNFVETFTIEAGSYEYDATSPLVVFYKDGVGSETVYAVAKDSLLDIRREPEATAAS